MRNRFAWILIAAWLLVLAGCAGVATPPSATVTTAPAGSTAPEAQQPGDEAIFETVPVKPAQNAEMSGNRAVIALLERAQLDTATGQREAAGAALERALRIEPRNPWLWLQLAQLRLAQGQYAQAITLAKKSNSFARKNTRVQAENWQVIGEARAAQGDSAGAELALKRAAELALQAKTDAERNPGLNIQ